jgi:hypothetical protein
MSIAGMAWFVDLLMAVYATMIYANKYHITMPLLFDPTQYLFEMIYNNHNNTPTHQQRHLLMYSVIIESILWIPFVVYWSWNNCFIDGMMDMSNPIALYSTLMITNMYMNLIPHILIKHRLSLMSILLFFVAFYNTNYVIVLLVLLN